MAADGHLGMTALSRVILGSAGLSCYTILLHIISTLQGGPKIGTVCVRLFYRQNQETIS